MQTKNKLFFVQSFTDIKPALRYLAGDETKISQSKIGLYHYFLQTKTKEKIFKSHHRYWESKSLFTIINNMKCSGQKKNCHSKCWFLARLLFTVKKINQQCQVLRLSYLLLMHTVREKLLTCKSLNFKECELIFKSHLLCTASTHIATCFLNG